MIKIIGFCFLAVFTNLTEGTTNAHSLAECRAVIDRGFNIGNCPAYGSCASEAHTLAEKCVALERKNPVAKACNERENVKEAHKQWFKLTCLWHDAFSRCMAGEEIPQSVLGFRFKRNIEYLSRNERVERNSPAGARECWQQVTSKLADCKRIGVECEHYSVCAGDQEDTETPGDNQAAWFEHVASLRQRKHEKMREYHAIMQSCMRESVMMGDEPVGDSQIPAESTVKPKRGKKQKGQSSSESLESSSSEEHFRQ